MKKLIPKDSILVPDQASLVFKGMIFDVYQWPQKLFDGSEHTFEMLKRTDTVSVITIVDDKIILLEDEQPHLGMRRGFPGGRVDDTDESILAAAKRETLEETGYSLNNWRLVRVNQPYRKIEWFIHVWLAWDANNKQETSLDAGEKIAASELSFSEVKDTVMGSSDFTGASQDIFKNLNSMEELLALPEFDGQSVDR